MRPSKISFLTIGALIMISVMGTTPFPLAFFAKRWQMIAFTTSERDFRMESRSSMENMSRIRLMDCGASLVCRVVITMWPVSAAARAVSKVVRLRISPTTMISGSCRSAWTSAESKVSASSPTSRCSKKESLSSKVYSMGSSMVMMCFRKLVLMKSSMAAMVVDLPEPVVPVMKMIPLLLEAMVLRTSGSPASFTVGALLFTQRIVMPRLPRCKCRFTRKRPASGSCQAKSKSPFARNSSYLPLGTMSLQIWSNMAVSVSKSSWTRLESMRNCTFLFSRMCKSLARSSTAYFSRSWRQEVFSGAAISGWNLS